MSEMGFSIGKQTGSNVRCGVTASIARFQVTHVIKYRADRGSIPRNGTIFIF